MKVRESQFELLRIVAMAMILMVHFNGVVMEKFLPVTAQPFVHLWGAELLESMAIIGVNLFVLISGYFGIRFTANGMLKYVLWVLWYSIGLFLIACCLHPQILFDAKYAEPAMLGISHSTQWFVTSYFFLMALSPAINELLDRITYRGHLMLVAVLVVINCGLGWWCEMAFNETGYTVYHMIFIYCLGRTLREMLDRYPHFRWAAVGVPVYLLSVAAVVLMMQHMKYFKVISYNNPVIVIESIAFFVIFARFSFKNRFVNCVASTSFAVYLIHMHFSVWPHMLRPMLSNIYDTYGGIGYVILATLVGVATFAICTLVDKPREWLFTRLFAKPKRVENDENQN